MAPPPVDYALYYVTGREQTPAGIDFFDSLEQACKGGVTVVQRELDLAAVKSAQADSRCSEGEEDLDARVSGHRQEGEGGLRQGALKPSARDHRSAVVGARPAVLSST